MAMTVQMNIAEAKAKLSELVARAEAGEEVVIARDGVPAVALKPVEAPAQRPRRLGFLSHLGPVVVIDPNWEETSEEDLRAAEGDADDPLLRDFGAAAKRSKRKP
jgi:prevent-host-death family protein